MTGIVAQRSEQDAHNVLVVGSIPTNPTIFIHKFQETIQVYADNFLDNNL